MHLDLIIGGAVGATALLMACSLLATRARIGRRDRAKRRAWQP